MISYRGSGADWPFGHPERAHGVAMEGYFWRVSTPDRAIIALIGVNRGPRGPWATLGVATTPAGGPRGPLVEAAVDGAIADPGGLGAAAGDAFRGDARSVRVRLPDAELDLRVDAPRLWPHRAFGGSSVFQCVPALNQYWHPWLLGGRASGRLRLAGVDVAFADAAVYGEKNWGRGGFPEAWWWGQAQGFDDPAACVAFAGGVVSAGPVRTEVTGLVVALPDGRVLRLGDPVVTPVRARVTDETWALRGRSREWAVDVDGWAPLERAHVLPVPLPAEHRNTPGAIEHLAGELTVTVRRRGRPYWHGHSRLAGLEHGGLARAEALLSARGDARPLAGAGGTRE